MNVRKHICRLTVLLTALAVLLCACAKVPGMEEKDGTYTNPKTGITYVEAPWCYRAASYDPENAVARIKNGKIDDNVLYAVNRTVSADRMLTTDDYRLFCAEGVTLPTMQEMQVTQVLIGQTVSITANYAVIKNAAEVKELVDLYCDGPFFGFGQVVWVAMHYERYELRFASEAYDGLYYYLEYYQCTEDVIIQERIDDPEDFDIKYAGASVSTEEWNGEWYVNYNFGSRIIVDRASGRCYPVGDLIDSYL